MTALLPKPAYGSPCNSCGQCCLVIQCPLSSALFGKRGVCPALERSDGAALTCGLTRAPGDYFEMSDRWPAEIVRETFTLLIGAGIGCDAPTEDDDPDAVKAKRPGLYLRAAQTIANATPAAQQMVAYLRGAL